RWLVENLGGILAQAARELLNLFRGRPPFAQEALQVRQPLTGERADILTVVLDDPIELTGRIGEVVGGRARMLYGRDDLRPGGLHDRVGAVRGRGQLLGGAAQIE